MYLALYMKLTAVFRHVVFAVPFRRTPFLLDLREHTLRFVIDTV